MTLEYYLFMAVKDPYGGAALLCIQTALKTGIGLVYSLFHGSQNDEILKQFPEVICLESLDQIKLTIKRSHL